MLAGCSNGTDSPSRLSPIPPALPAELSAPCLTAAPLPSNDIAAMALKLAEVGKLLAECAVGKAGAVNSYVAAREAAIEWNSGQQ